MVGEDLIPDSEKEIKVKKEKELLEKCIKEVSKKNKISEKTLKHVLKI